MHKTFPNLSIAAGKGKLPRLPFLKMKEAVLGKNYELSVVFTDSITSQKLNRLYRKKNKPANVLSFPLSKKSGEIYLDLKEIKKSEKVFGRQGDRLVGFFFVHALLHLKGSRHGVTMERKEARLKKRFKI